MSQTDKYMNQSDDELLLLLAEEIVPSGNALDLRSVSEKITDANNWLNENHLILKYRICTHDVIQKSLSDDNTISNQELIAAIADAISLVISGITPFLIAVIIYKRGIAKFCENQKPSDD